MFHRKLFFLLACVFQITTQANTTDLSFEQLEARGAVVENIIIKRNNVFEDSQIENSKIRRLVNRFHVTTKEEVIRSQLVIQPNSSLEAALVKESERILRNNKYLYSATITAINIQDKTLDLLVETTDIWTLSPEIDFNRSGNDNFYTLGIEDDNLFGTGASLTLSRSETFERTSNLFIYSNNNFLSKRLRFRTSVVDSDDGNSYSVSLEQPFFALGTRTAAGISLNDTQRSDFFYRTGDDVGEYQRDLRSFDAFRGWSTGRRNGWVRRLVVGLYGEQNNFSLPQDLTRNLGTPVDRELLYPYVSINFLQDKFVTAKNFRNISRVEDIYLGTQYGLLLGYSSEAFGSDRNSLILAANSRHSFGHPDSSLLSVSTSASSRFRAGDWNNFTSRVNLNWNHKQSDHWRFYAQLDLIHNENPDLDNFTTLGGSSGLRGYPNRFRNGRGRGVLTVEQRYFSDWYPFDVFRVGGAVFLDVGQVWGENILGETNDDLLSDVGFGLRLANTRGGSNKIVHLDLAFPIGASKAIDDVQFIVEVKREF